MAITEATPSPLEFEVTPLRKARHKAWLGRYIRKIGDLWEEQGVDIKCYAARQRLRDIKKSMMVPEREEWMHPGLAVAMIAMWGSVDTLVSSDNLEYRDAIRSLSSLTISERKRVVAHAMGIQPAIASRMYSTRNEGLQGATTLYRHYDAAGTLLYVGIAGDFEERSYWHSRNSKWYVDVCSSTIEWFNTRAEALRAESRAIKSEEPVFNIAGARERQLSPIPTPAPR